MPGLKIHTSNRLETLAEQLANVLSAPAGPPLAPDVIVVQSRAMARWVSLEIARLSGLCMNCEFPFPRAFIERALRVFFPEMADAAEFSADVMAWKIHRLLPSLARKKEFAPVKNYLVENDALKSFQFSQKIARLFDQYLVYRAEMLMRWERGSGEKEWQAILWRALAGEKMALHPAALHEALDGRMAARPSGGTLPGRISIFGISSLPPFYLRVFFGLSRHCEINLFSLHPSREYHGHDLSPKRKARLLSRAADRGAKISADDLPSGNPLLASLGRLNREFTDTCLELDERAGFVAYEQPEQFIEPDGDGMLATVQGDILRARNRGDGGNPKIEIAPGDRSIQIHACHSPMREMEALYDQLLDLFDKDPSLKPRDIFVMTPDIEKYAPFIEAVFAFPEDDRLYIPFSVADRPPLGNSETIDTFLSLLALPGSRCTASEIFSLLESVPIRRRFKFTDGDLTQIRQWIVGSGIRWGIDAAHRAGFDLPELEANTWRAGFRRLLLGCAMAGGNRVLFEDIMPCDEVEGGLGETLGRFLSAAEALFSLVTQLSEARPLAQWPDALGALPDRFFPSDTPEEVGDLRLIRTALEHLRRVAELTGGDQKVEFRAVRHHLSQLLEETGQRGGFLTGGVTFCALKPMRSIPARVLCLVGMDDQAFPRQSGAPEFDLMARDRKCGDPSPRDDDRYSFLEAIISARELFYISYIGRSAIDNGEIPPSVLVSELLDYLDQAFVFPDKKKTRDFIVREHRLHAFSPRYFDGKNPGLFSYSAANAAASRGLEERHGAEGKGLELLSAFSLQPFKEPLPEPGEEVRNVELGALTDFFSSPARHFVRQRLGIRLEEKDDTLVDDEPFKLDNLERYQFKQELVARSLEKLPADHREFAARGVLPLGGIGASAFHTLNREAGDFLKKVEPELRDAAPEEPLAVDLRAGAFSLSGKIEPIYGGRIVQFRCAKLKPKDRLSAWILHLAKCAAAPDAVNETLLIGGDETVRFAPVKNAAELLANLLAIYWRGLCKPLPFFPASALEYAAAELLPSGHAQLSPIEKARRKWHGSEYRHSGEKDGEATKNYTALCFGKADPLDGEFASLALAVFGPLLQNANPSA